MNAILLDAKEIYFISSSRCPDGGSKIAIAYCNLEFQAALPDTPKESYIFHVGEIVLDRYWTSEVFFGII